VEMGPAVETCPCSVIGLAFEPGVDPNLSDFAWVIGCALRYLSIWPMGLRVLDLRGVWLLLLKFSPGHIKRLIFK